jgi:hypothetical protein
MPYRAWPQPFSSVDIPDDDWNTAAGQWQAAQGQYDPVAPGSLDQVDLDEGVDPTDPETSAQLASAEMPHAQWQLLRARKLAAGSGENTPLGDDTISGDAITDVLKGSSGDDRLVAATRENPPGKERPIDPQRTQVFQPGPDGKLHPISGWHTTGPFDFGVWSHDINWPGVASDLADIGTNAAMAMEGVGVLGAIQKGTATNVGRMTAEAARKQLRRRGAAVTGEEIHHSVALNGISRTAENWRNHPAFLKVLSQADHRRLTGSWKGLPQYGPIQRFVVGTPNWMKTVPAWLGVHGFDWLSGLHHDQPGSSNLGDPSVPPLL